MLGRSLLASVLVAITTGCKPTAESPLADSPPDKIEPPPKPKPEPAKLEQPPPPDHGVYVAIPGGEHDGHEIPDLLFKQTEVTVAEYRACFEWGACSKPHRGERCNRPPDHEQHPVNCVSWSQATEYCAWAGGRLPTQWEWEWAAQGREAARPYPWGREAPSCTRAVMSAPECEAEATSPVASKPEGATVDGLHDMVGNVWEWTSAPGERGPYRILKGGSWAVANPGFMRVDYDLSSPRDSQSVGDGFRCVRDQLTR